MTHDPLCPIKPADQLAPQECWRCALIARVREYEQAKAFDALCAIEHEMWQLGQDTQVVARYRMGRGEDRYAAALRDAIAAVESREDGEYFPWPQVEIAIAAITELQP